MAVVNSRTAKSTLSQLIARAQAGEEIVLARGTQPVAKIVATEPVPQKRQAGAYRGKISIDPAFFAPLPDDELDAWSARVERTIIR
jgi:antitoxin (DNA-binding transcriptional repressor) of toxin-antitoxin stability system